MSQDSASSRHDHLTGPPSARHGEETDARPRLTDVAIGLVAWTVGAFLLTPQLRRLDLDPAVHGLVLTAMSGVIGAAAFAVVRGLRGRAPRDYGLRPVSRRWILIAVVAGVVTLVVKSLASGAWILLSGDTTNPQSQYAEGASGGVLFLVLATLFLGVVTPVGEELLFRGVVAHALLRYGWIFGVVGSALIFALYHGINSVLPGAFVIGLVTAELLRRTRSIWPSIVVHVVVNLPAPLISVLAGLG